MAIALVTGYTWVDGEVETAVKLNLTGTPTVTSGGTYTFGVGSAASPGINFTGFTTAGLFYASGVGVAVGGVQVGLFTATGLNGAAIGATTPGAGAFTTLSASSGLNSTAVGNSTPSTGAFTTLSSSGLASLSSLALGTDLPLTEGGTGASTAGGARTSLELHGVVTTADGSNDGTQFSASGAPIRTSRSTDTTVSHLVFFNPNGSVGGISTDGFSTVYNTSSDVRIKHDIRDLVDVSAIIDAVRPRIFKWLGGNTDAVGFVAQELYEVFPSAVKVGTEETGDRWGVDLSKLVPLLFAEVKSLRARVAALEGPQNG